MGFRFRKSINLGGGFRINLSKSGIGYSWGTKGFRISKTARGTTRRTYSIPGTGISYVEEAGSRTGARNRNDREERGQDARKPQQPARPAYKQAVEHTMQSTAVSQINAAETDAVSNALERTIRLDWIGNILLWGALLLFINPIFILLPAAGLVLKTVSHTVGRVALEYSFDLEKEEEHIRRMDAWQLLAEGKKEWQILSARPDPGGKGGPRKGKLLERADCKIEKGCPYYIKTNVETVQIRLHGKERLIILPDKVFFVRGRNVAMVDYPDFHIRVSSIQFAETDSVPEDAQVVGHTWKYVNQNGTPDRRYKNNAQIPLCLYSLVFLRSPSVLDVELQISNVQNARDFAALIT